jgi:ferredoxin-NADP reductase
MVTEPLTMPPTKKFQMMYGALVGVLSSVPFSFGFLYSSPELALCIGNIFSYSVSMNRRILFRLKEKTYIAKDICEFIFQADCACVFSPGQYMEWTLPHEHPDARGIRRYFTLASSPTEKEIRIAVRFTAPLSSFKKKLRLLECGDTMLASQLCGDFVLPKKTDKKIGYIAGGIGITPFRSMMKYCIDTREKRDSILFYVNKTPEDIAYTELLHEVCAYSMRVVYSVDAIGNTVEWNGEIGVFTSKIIEKYISDAQERLWYISGPQGMVGAYKKILLGMGVKRGNIKTDYFPGYA